MIYSGIDEEPRSNTLTTIKEETLPEIDDEQSLVENIKQFNDIAQKHMSLT